MHEAFLAITTEFVVLPWRHAMQSALEGASQGGSQVSPSIWPFHTATCIPAYLHGGLPHTVILG